MPVKNSPIHIIEKKPISQAHYILGAPAYDIHHSLKTPLLLTNNVLGGMGMSSRLNMEIREKHGIAYTVESNYSPLTDTGILTIYFGTESDKLDKARSILFKELKKIRDIKLGPIQLLQAKRKYIGQIALGEENRISLIIALAKNVIDHGYAESLEQIFTKINNVSAEQIQEVAQEILSSENMSSLVFSPEED